MDKHRFNVAMIVHYHWFGEMFHHNPTYDEMECYTQLLRNRNGHANVPILIAIVGSAGYSNSTKKKAIEQVRQKYDSLDVLNFIHLDLSPIGVQSYLEMFSTSSNYSQQCTIKQVDRGAIAKEVSKQFDNSWWHSFISRI